MKYTLLFILSFNLSLVSCSKKSASPTKRHVDNKQSPIKITQKPTNEQKERLRKMLRQRREAWKNNGPMRDIMPFAKKLEQAIENALINIPNQIKTSKNPKEFRLKNHFEPFKGTNVRPQLLKEIEKINPSAIRLMGFEYELIFSKKQNDKNQDKLYLRTFLHAGENGPEFFKISARIPKDHKVGVESIELDQLKGELEPLKKAANGLVSVLKEKRCKSLPTVSIEPLLSIMQPGPLTQRMRMNLRRAKKMRNKACELIEKNYTDQYRLRVDDISIALLDQSKKIASMIRGEIKIVDNSLFIRIKNLRSMR